MEPNSIGKISSHISNFPSDSICDLMFLKGGAIQGIQTVQILLQEESKISYLPGGVQSGMNYVAEEKIHKRLFLIKGRGKVIASQECIKIILRRFYDRLV